MQHEWIINVLADLQAYAEKNALPRIAAEAARALATAQAELAGLQGQDGPAATPRAKPN